MFVEERLHHFCARETLVVVKHGLRISCRETTSKLLVGYVECIVFQGEHKFVSRKKAGWILMSCGTILEHVGIPSFRRRLLGQLLLFALEIGLIMCGSLLKSNSDICVRLSYSYKT